MAILKIFGSSNIKKFVERYLNSEASWLKQKTIVDIPAGSGYTSRVIDSLGGVVKAYDLFPEFFEFEGVDCEEADLQKPLPIDSDSADMLICQEGIEHLPDQLRVLQEFSRILKPGGRLILTTPNISHLRAKVSYLMTESELYKRMPANELDSLWFSGDDKMYFGHLFLINAQKLRSLAAIAGFRLRRTLPVKISTSSVLLSFLYPVIVLLNVYAYLRNVYKKDEYDIGKKKKLYKEILKLNISPVVLFGKHIFWELEKDQQIQFEVNRTREGII